MAPDASTIHGVQIRRFTTHRDDRGSVTELLRQSWLTPGLSMPQANLSISRAGVLRGMHYHLLQSDWWVLMQGKAFVGMHDLRDGSPTQGLSDSVVFDADSEDEGFCSLLIPPGVAHGFCALTDIRMLYLVTEEFTGADEYGFRWNDPGLGFSWPIAEPIVSERDSNSATLEEVLAAAPPFGG